MRTEQFVAMKQIEARNRQITELQERVLTLSEALRRISDGELCNMDHGSNCEFPHSCAVQIAKAALLESA